MPTVFADQVRILVVGSQLFDHRLYEGSDLLTVGFARDYPLALHSRFAFAGELYPFLLFHQDTGTNTSDEREFTPGAAAAGLIAYRGTFSEGRWGYRVELGSGGVYSPYRAVPAGGTRVNFYDQAGFAVTRHQSAGPAVSLGYRWIHISNLSLFHNRENPGVDFHALVIALEWPR